MIAEAQRPIIANAPALWNRPTTGMNPIECTSSSNALIA